MAGTIVIREREDFAGDGISDVIVAPDIASRREAFAAETRDVLRRVDMVVALAKAVGVPLLTVPLSPGGAYIDELRRGLERIEPGQRTR